MKKLLSAIACAALLLSASTASAAVPCTALTKTMSVGSTDAGTGGEVSKLQIFLGSTGFFSGEATGYFGPITQSAVLSFQVAGGLEAIGSVGEQTRATIAAGSCAAGTVTVGASQRPAAPAVAPNLISISPTSGKIGDTVKLKGSGFVSGTLVLFGDGAVRPAISASGTRITFRVPEALVPECSFDRVAPCSAYAIGATKGKYSVRVKTPGGESGSKKFTLKNSASSVTGASVLNGSSVTTGSVNFSFPVAGQTTSGGSSSSGAASVNFSFPTSGRSTSASTSASGASSTVTFTFPTVNATSTGN